MRCSNPKALRVFAGCALWLAALGWIDCATGSELGLFAFYTAPVAVVAWNLGLGPGIIVAFIASVIWYTADRYAGDRYSAPFYGYWNTGMHFATFIINAVTFAKIKSSLGQRHKLERALVESREQVKQLAGLIPPCPQCHKPHVPEPLRPKPEKCRAPMPPEPLPTALRDDCRKQVAPGNPSLPHQDDVGASITLLWKRHAIGDPPDIGKDCGPLTQRSP